MSEAPFHIGAGDVASSVFHRWGDKDLRRGAMLPAYLAPISDGRSGLAFTTSGAVADRLLVWHAGQHSCTVRAASSVIPSN